MRGLQSKDLGRLAVQVMSILLVAHLLQIGYMCSADHILCEEYSVVLEDV